MGEGFHPVQDGIDLRHNILSVYEDRRVFAIAQGHVQNGASLGLVDGIAVEHALDGTPEVGFLRQTEEKVQRRAGDAVLGTVDQDVVEPI